MLAPPLTPTVFFVMLTLAEASSHGYAIMKRSQELSEGTVKMGPGALYTTIQRLTEEGLIEELDSMDDPRRRLYQLTGQGRALLVDEVSRMESLVKTARRLKLRPQGR
jgi:DNA-binding PadR family transcriptional regulator